MIIKFLFLPLPQLADSAGLVPIKISPKFLQVISRRRLLRVFMHYHIKLFWRDSGAFVQSK